ncbi:MAG: hypothetical protein COV07_02875, partial [Candidatus Vogelbacteria bacterium CG10_big_fil_rev_8_21_14_0_10_45_14]
MRKINFVVGVFVFLFAIALFAQNVNAAWLPPSATPPRDNTPPPLNVGGAGQEKMGGLTIGLQLFNSNAANPANCFGSAVSGINNCTQGFFGQTGTWRGLNGSDPLNSDGFGLKVVNGRILSYGSGTPSASSASGFCLGGPGRVLECVTNWSDILNMGGSGGSTIINQIANIVNNTTNTTETTDVENIYPTAGVGSIRAGTDISVSPTSGTGQVVTVGLNRVSLVEYLKTLFGRG